MKKYLLVSLLILMTGCSSTSDKNIPKKYLKHFDGSLSGVEIQCQKDNDCRLLNLESGCGEPSSLNKGNSENILNQYNKKEEALLEGIEFDCMNSSEIKDILPICENNICSYKMK